MTDKEQEKKEMKIIKRVTIVYVILIIAGYFLAK